MAGLEFTNFYVQGANVAGYPDPNTLAVTDPLNAAASTNGDVSSAWQTQAKKLIAATSDGMTRRLRLGIETSVDGAGWTIQPWVWSKVTSKWLFLTSAGSGVGNQVLDIEDVGNDPVYLQVVTLSSGTLDISIGTREFQVF